MLRLFPEKLKPVYKYGIKKGITRETDGNSYRRKRHSEIQNIEDYVDGTNASVEVDVVDKLIGCVQDNEKEGFEVDTEENF